MLIALRTEDFASPLAPAIIEVDRRSGLPSLTVRRNGSGLASRTEALIVAAMREQGYVGADRLTVNIRDRIEPSAATIAAWIIFALDRMDAEMSAHVDLSTRDGALAYLMADGNLSVPCSRYGFDTESCAPVAYVAATIVAAETVEKMTEDMLDHVMGLVVNNHDDIEYLIRSHGAAHGFDPADYLED